MTEPQRDPGFGSIVADGIWRRNPVLAGSLGVCSALAVTARLETALVMALAVTAVLCLSGAAVSLTRNFTPRRIRLIVWIALIATFVVLADECLQAFLSGLARELGPYTGLIVTNCIILGRAEAFASRRPPTLAVADGLANGAGYGLALALVAVIRELFGSGMIRCEQLLGEPRVLLSLGERYPPNAFLQSAPGAFIVMGLLAALANRVFGGGRRDA